MCRIALNITGEIVWNISAEMFRELLNRNFVISCSGQISTKRVNELIFIN